MNTEVLFSSNSDEWATPAQLYEQLDAEFHFNLDPCAAAENHKCQKYYDKQANGLSENWGVPGVLQSPILTNCRMGGQMLLRKPAGQHACVLVNTGPH